MKLQNVCNALKLKRRCDDTAEVAEAKTPPRKRTRFESATTAPPVKKVASVQSSPVPSASTSASTPFTFAIGLTPATMPHALRLPDYSPPSDSPTNPFGPQRSLTALNLPVAVPFSKHLALRFQLVCKDSEKDDVCRIVQVPRNYSFRLLHKLILWLFASDARIRMRTPGRFTPHRRSERKGKSRVHATLRPRATPPLEGLSAMDVKGKKKAQPVWVSHCFDVYHKMEMYRSNYKRGVIKAGTGELYTRLSSAREGRIFDDLLDEQETEHPSSDDVFGDSHASQSDLPSSPLKGKGAQVLTAIGKEKTTEGEGDEPEQGWIWEAEDDFTLGHVWPAGLDTQRGIIYRHLPDVSVHITLNTQKLPPRKGQSNTPFLFRLRGGSCGAIRIAHVASPDALPPFNPVDEQEWEDFSDEARIDRLNIPTSFPNFLRREAERETPQLANTVPSPPSTPAKSERDPETPLKTAQDRKKKRPATPHARNVARAESLPPSSPPSADHVPSLGPKDRAVAGPSRPVFPHRSTYPPLDALVSGSSASPASSPFPHPTPAPIMLTMPTVTPHPSHPLHRRRLSRMMRRIERLTHDGLNVLSDRETEDEKDGESKNEDPKDGESKSEEEAEQATVVKQVIQHRVLRVTQAWPVPPKVKPFVGKGKGKGKVKSTKVVPQKRLAKQNSPDIFQALEFLARKKLEGDYDSDEFFSGADDDLVESDGLLDGWVKNWNPYDEEEI